MGLKIVGPTIMTTHLLVEFTEIFLIPTKVRR
jgi:hypothetical protein